MNETKSPVKDPARWEQRYVDGDLPWDTGVTDAHLQRMLAAGELTPGRAVEIGCGTGTHVIWLAQQGWDVVGADLSPTAIAQAEAKVAAAGVTCRLLVADLLTDDVPGGPFALAYDRGCFHVFDEADLRARFAERLAALLEPGALWLSVIGSTDGPPRDTGPPRRSATQIAAAVEPHFEVLELRSTSFDEDRHAHARAWAMVARRRAPSDARPAPPRAEP